MPNNIRRQCEREALRVDFFMKEKHQLGLSEKVAKTKTFNKVHNKMLMFVLFGKYLWFL